MALEMNYLDDILDASVNARRKYNLIQNDDGTVSFEDVTKYTQSGSVFGAKDVNEIIREIISLKAKDLGFENLSNPNLLINGDFQVWQRGESFDNTMIKSSYVVYTADRWWTYYEGNSFTVRKGANGGLVISKGQSIFQTLETKLEVGETYTLSAKVNDEILTYTFVGGEYNDWNVTPNGLQYRTWGEYDCIHVLGDVSSERTIYWVKLEKGSLATPFVPRLYAEELAMCERYYQTYQSACLWSRNNTDFNGFPLRTEMRTTPTIAWGYYLNPMGHDVTSKASNVSMNKNMFLYIIFSENIGVIAYISFGLDAEIY